MKRSPILECKYSTHSVKLTAKTEHSTEVFVAYMCCIVHWHAIQSCLEWQALIYHCHHHHHLIIRPTILRAFSGNFYPCVTIVSVL